VNECRQLQHGGLLQSFLDGEVVTSDALRVAFHLDGCPACGREARALQQLKAALRRQRVSDPEAVARLCAFAALLTRGCR
jgi:anti-sigma factor RsiW